MPDLWNRFSHIQCYDGTYNPLIYSLLWPLISKLYNSTYCSTNKDNTLELADEKVLTSFRAACQYHTDDLEDNNQYDDNDHEPYHLLNDLLGTLQTPVLGRSKSVTFWSPFGYYLVTIWLLLG